MATVGPSTEPTTDIGELWKNAIDQYENITKVKIQSLRGPNNLSALLAEIQETHTKFEMRRHDGSRLDEFRILVKKSLTPIQLLGNIVALATKIIFPPSEAIFAAISYLISVANTVSAGYDNISAFFQDLDTHLHQLKTLENKVPHIPELKLALTEVFTSVLVLCGVCAKYIKAKRLSEKISLLLYLALVFRSFVSENDELKAAYDHFHEMVRREQGIVTYAILGSIGNLKADVVDLHTDAKENLVVTHSIKRNTEALLDEKMKVHKSIEGQENTRERDYVLKWLSSLDFHEKQKAVFEEHQKGTNQWLLNTAEFRQWYLGPHNSILWCPGIPGAGKTVIVSHTVNYVHENTPRSTVAIAYVYCDYKNPTTQSGTGLLFSIIRQILEQSKLIPPEVGRFREKFSGKQRHPTDDERVALVKAISGVFEKTYIFVDALDECGEENRQHFLRLVKGMEAFVRLFITSRPHLQLQAKFANASRVDIVASKFDIQTYVEAQVETRDRLCDLISVDPSLKAEIVCKLVEKAAGMFLLSYLQINHLCEQLSVSQIRKSLESIPTGVHDLYEESFRRIEKQSENERIISRTALSYISCAKRPLSVDELRHALSVEAGSTELNWDNLPLAKILLNISAGLIRVDEGSNTTALVHYTLQEYLEEHPDKLLPEPNVEIAATCLTYLSFDVFKSGACSDEDALEKRLQEFPFLDYASHYWGDHTACDQLHERLTLLLKLLEDPTKVSSFVQVLHIPQFRFKGWHNNFPTQFSPLHVIAYWGLDKIFTIFHQRGIDINFQDSYGSTALQLASKRGHASTVRLLLENGAEVNMRNSKGETALYWAARNGLESIVNTLLSEGGDITIEDCEGSTALDWAVIRGHTAVVQLILGQRSDFDPEGDGRRKALILAAEAGNEVIVQMLLRNGAKINGKDDQGSTALDWAVPEGHERIVLALLRGGADVNSTDNYLNTPLHWAIPHESVARLLLAHGASISAKNDCGQTALHWSSQDGQARVLQLLLQHGADANVQDKYGFTPLHAAALKGREVMVRLLIGKGADPNVKDVDGWTPLHAAALRQHEGVVRILLDKNVRDGSDILNLVASQRKDAKKLALLEHMAERKSGGSTVITGLRWAVSEGRAERVQAILDNGAQVDAEDVGGCTALTIGAWMGQVATVQLLLEYGADVNKRERNGRSALHIASELGYLRIVRLLVNHGANIDEKVCGFTALLLAAKKGHSAVVHYLVEKGADVHTEDYHGRRLLHWAAKYGSAAKLKLLKDEGADINAADRWGTTPLMWALKNGQLAVARLLLDMGADVRSRAEDASTALHLAAYIGECELVRELLEEGASVNAKTQDHLTALHIAAFMGYEKVVRLLLEKGADTTALVQWIELEGESHEGVGNFRSHKSDVPQNGSDGISENDWEDVDSNDDNSDDEDNQDDGQYVGGERANGTPPLTRCLRRLLRELKNVTDIKSKAKGGLTAGEFAACGGNAVLQQLLTKE